MRNVFEFNAKRLTFGYHLNETDMKNLTEKESQTVKILISLGDSKALAIQTVINDRENEAKRQAQLDDYNKINN